MGIRNVVKNKIPKLIFDSTEWMINVPYILEMKYFMKILDDDQSTKMANHRKRGLTFSCLYYFLSDANH